MVFFDFTFCRTNFMGAKLMANSLLVKMSL